VIPFQLHRRIPLLRRPFYQRDRAIKQRDQAIAARDALLAGREGRDLADNFWWCRHRRAERIAGSAAVAAMPAFDDAGLIARVVAAYRTANATALGSKNSFWLQSFSDFKRPVHDALLSPDAETAVAPMLRNPGDNMLFYGFDNLTCRTGASASTEHGHHHIPVYDDLLRLVEALGVQRLDNPETLEADRAPETETILRGLDAVFGFTVRFPNPFPDEAGLATTRGVASYRAVQALYQAYRVAALVGDRPGARVVEIGGGLGRTAFYADQFGLRDYTVIDLPMSNVAQGYFLGRVLGPDAISLFGEDRPGIRVLPPVAFLNASDKYDIALNVDSLTEMAPGTAIDYCRAIGERADIFLSINHESNLRTARDICARLGMSASSRTPYWLRSGYLDEVFMLSAPR
jgi:hypothetical protein